jgi:hypothetical protein
MLTPIGCAVGRFNSNSGSAAAAAGGGTKQGTVFGTTDKEAGYPVDHPVRPCDLIATIYHLLGIDPHTLIHDRIGRPFPIARGGDPVQGVIA